MPPCARHLSLDLGGALALGRAEVMRRLKIEQNSGSAYTPSRGGFSTDPNYTLTESTLLAYSGLTTADSLTHARWRMMAKLRNGASDAGQRERRLTVARVRSHADVTPM